MRKIDAFREQYPAYAEVDDEKLARGIHKKFYSDKAYEDVRARLMVDDAPAPAAAPPERSWPRAVADTALSVGQGAVDLGKSLVGISNIATGNLVGEGLGAIGYDPEATSQALESLKSEKMQQTNRRVQQAEGLVGKAKAMLTEPTSIMDMGMRAAPGTLGIAGVVRKSALSMGAAAARSKAGMAKLTALSGAAEGAQSAGDIQETSRAAGVPWQESVVPALGAGAGVAATSILTSKIPGLGDAEVALATRGLRDATKKSALDIPKAIAKGAIKEGPLEEGTQSIIETAAQNTVFGRPTTEGMGEAWAQGTILGTALGGTMSAIGATGSKRPPAGTVDISTPEGVAKVAYAGQLKMGTMGLTTKEVHDGMLYYEDYLKKTFDDAAVSGTVPSQELATEMRLHTQLTDSPVAFLGASQKFQEYMNQEKTIGVAARERSLNLTGTPTTPESLAKAREALGTLKKPPAAELSQYEAARAQALKVPERVPAAPPVPKTARKRAIPVPTVPLTAEQTKVNALRDQVALLNAAVLATNTTTPEGKAAIDSMFADRANKQAELDLLTGQAGVAPVAAPPAPVAAPPAPVAAPPTPVAAPPTPVAAPPTPVAAPPAPVAAPPAPVAAPPAPVAAPPTPVAAPPAPIEVPPPLEAASAPKKGKKQAASAPKKGKKQAAAAAKEVELVARIRAMTDEELETALDDPANDLISNDLEYEQQRRRQTTVPAPPTEGTIVAKLKAEKAAKVPKAKKEVAPKTDEEIAAAALAIEVKAEEKRAAEAAETETRQRVIAGFNEMPLEELVAARDTMAADSKWRSTADFIIAQRQKEADQEGAEAHKIYQEEDAPGEAAPEPTPAVTEPASAAEEAPEVSPEELANRKRISDGALTALAEMEAAPGKAGYIRVHKMAKELHDLGVIDEFTRDSVLEEKNGKDARDVLEEWLKLEHGDVGETAEGRFSTESTVPTRPTKSFDRTDAEAILRKVMRREDHGFTIIDDATKRTDWNTIVKGFYGKGGKGINLAEMVDADMVRRIASHEAVHEDIDSEGGQKILTKFVREELDWGMLVKTMPAYPIQKVKQADGSKDWETQDQYIRRVVDEYLAKLGENRQRSPEVWDRLVLKVKQFLNAVGARNLTTVETEEALLWRIEKAGRGKRGPGGERDTSFSTAPPNSWDQWSEKADHARKMAAQARRANDTQLEKLWSDRAKELGGKVRGTSLSANPDDFFGGGMDRFSTESTVPERRTGDPARRKLVDEVASFQVRSINELLDIPEEKLKAVHQYLLDREASGTLSRAHGPMSAERFATDPDDVFPRTRDAEDAILTPPQSRTYEERKALVREGILRNVEAFYNNSPEAKMYQGLLRGLPGAMSEKHLRKVEYVGGLLGEKSHVLEQAHVVLEKVQDAFAKMGIGNPKTALEKNAGVIFMSKVMSGKTNELPPEQQAMAEAIKPLLQNSYARALKVLLSDPQMTVPKMAERMLGTPTVEQAKNEDNAAFRKRAEKAAMEQLATMPEYAQQPKETNAAHTARIAPLIAAQILENETARTYFPTNWTAQSRAALNLALSEMREAKKQEDAMGAEETGEVTSAVEISVLELSPEKQLALRTRVEELLASGKGIDNDAAFAAAFARRPIEGKKGFLKQKYYKDIMDGIAVGLQPFSKNPADLVNHKLVELEQFILGRTVRNSATFFPVGKDFHKEGWRVPKDPSFTLQEPPEKGGRTLGHYYVENELADVIDAYMTKTLYNHPNPLVSEGYKKLMRWGSLLNQSQLGMGSMFHAGFMYSEASVSAWANVLKDAYRAGFKHQLGWAQVGRSVQDALLVSLPGYAYKHGKPMVNAWKNGTTDEEMLKIIRAFELGGGRFEMERGLVTNDLTKVKEAAYGKDYAKLAKNPTLAVGAVTEVLAKFVMKHIVPTHKAAVFAELAARIIRDNPGKTLEQLQPEFRQAVNRVDARLGQVGYDRLFMNNSVKNVIQMLVRAPGWTGGTIAEVGGSGKDMVKFLKDWKKSGKMPEQLPDRVAYTLSLFVVVTTVNAALTMMFTGDSPDELTDKDYFAFRTGGFDEKGRPERFLLPTYLKDVKSYWKDTPKTLTHKIHPIWSGLKQALIDNKDFYGLEIRDRDENWGAQLADLAKFGAKQFTPFYWQSMGRVAEREGGVGKMLSSGSGVAKGVGQFFGVAPAPAAYAKSSAEKLLDEYTNRESRKPLGTIAAERRDTRAKARHDLIVRNDRTTLAKARAEGKITAKEARRIVQSRNEDSLVYGVHQNLTFTEALRVYDVADTAEKKKLLPVIKTKYRNTMKSTPRAYQQELREQYSKTVGGGV